MRTRPLIEVALVATLVPALVAAPALPHATLTATTPEAGASLGAAPARVVLRFDEPVETAGGAVRVYDARREQVQAGTPFHLAGDARTLAVRLRPALAKGGYVATFRTVSVDSHAVSGGFPFDIGGAGHSAVASVSELQAGQGGWPLTSAAFAAVRAIQYAAIALGIGVLAVLLLAWLPALRAVATPVVSWQIASAAFAHRARALLQGAAVGGVVTAWLALPLQAATTQGTSPWSALGDVPLVLSTRFGVIWGSAVLAWLAVAVIVAGNGVLIPVLRPATLGATGVALPGAGGWLPAVAAPVMALALLPGLAGHAGARPPVVVLLPANLLHVLAAGAWIGGLAVLVVALPAAARRLDGPQRSELLSGVLARFSTLALTAVGLVLAGGVAQSLLELGAPGDLIGTPFGRAVSVKAALVAGLLACGAVNRRRALPALARAASEGRADGGSADVLRRTLRIEVALGLAALATSGALAGYQP